MRHASALFVALLLFGPVQGADLVLPQPDESHVEREAEGELGKLLDKMAESCKASQEVFEPLSVEQMSWRPPNGTHTARWNVEHMAGCQLLFFSQIYAEIDPEHHEEVDINPEQMPPDYVAAHPDWSGEQEAELMRRVNAYVMGHAYLLEGLDLDEKAPGSRWVLRGLLEQMERHFDEHTENVRKKMELPEWPAN